MIDTSKCETKEELEEAMHYEDLKFNLQKTTQAIWACYEAIDNIKLRIARLDVKNQNFKQELEKYKDKPYVVHTE